MKILKELLEQLDLHVNGEALRACRSSRRPFPGCGDNCLFICIKGANFDGHQAAYQAAADGAAAILAWGGICTGGFSNADTGRGYPICDGVCGGGMV